MGELCTVAPTMLNKLHAGSTAAVERLASIQDGTRRLKDRLEELQECRTLDLISEQEYIQTRGQLLASFAAPTNQNISDQVMQCIANAVEPLKKRSLEQGLVPAPKRNRRLRFKQTVNQHGECNPKRPGTENAEASCFSQFTSPSGDDFGFYDELRISRSATPDEIRLAYKQRCRETHPDKTRESAAPFVRVHKAFEILSDAERRAQYDKAVNLRGSADGMNTTYAARAAQLMQAEREDRDKARLQRARRLHLRLLYEVTSIDAQRELLTHEDAEVLQTARAWASGKLASVGKRSDHVKLKLPGINIRKNSYDASKHFDQLVISSQQIQSLSTCVGYVAALVSLKEIATAKKPEPLSLEDLMHAIHMEPTIELRLHFSKRINNKAMYGPVFRDLRKALAVHKELVLASKTPGPLAQIAKNVGARIEEAHAQIPSSNAEYDRKASQALEMINDALASRGQVRSTQPLTPTIAQVLGVRRENVRPLLQQIERLSVDERSLRTSYFLSGERDERPYAHDELKCVPSDAFLQICMLLQLRTLCYMKCVARTYLVKVSPNFRARVTNFVYTMDCFENQSCLRLGRSMEPSATTDIFLKRFLAQETLWPLFRSLDLRHVPADVLENGGICECIKGMKHLTSVIYPRSGWRSTVTERNFRAPIRRVAHAV